MNSNGTLYCDKAPLALFDNYISIARLELVDEYEEIDLVLAHYALAWGFQIKAPELGEDSNSLIIPTMQADLDAWQL